MWVIAEQENGQLMNVTFELLGAAKELCAKLEEKCCAVLVTAAAGELPQQLIAAGADVVYVVEDAKYADYDTELYTDAICQLSKNMIRLPLCSVLPMTAVTWLRVLQHVCIPACALTVPLWM